MHGGLERLTAPTHVPFPCASPLQGSLSDLLTIATTSPLGYYMLRDDRYPLEDQCLRCDANTYLLDQSNFSACLNCPVGATCSGGDDVTTLPGFWRQPDDWINNWTNSNNSRRSAHQSPGNDAGEIPSFLQRAALEIKEVVEELGLLESPSSDMAQRRKMDPNVTHRPRPSVVHKCLPGDCDKENVCNKNRTGPACGLCPQGWAVTAAGCEECPPPDDPAMLLLQMGVFVVGGFVST